MNLIERYIFGRAAQLTLITLAATTVVVLITQVLIYVNVLTDSGQAIGTFMKLALMLVPAMLVVVMPFALLIGASQTLSGMNSDSELAVIESAGGSPLVVAKPIVILGLLLSFATLGIALFVEPWSNRQIRDLVSDAGADMVRFAVQSGAFKQLDENLYIQIAEQEAGGGFGGIFIADLRDPAVEMLYYAKRGAIVEQDGTEILLMADGEIHRKNPSTGEISIIRFASYAIDFSQFGAAGKTPNYFPKERSTLYLINPDPNDQFTQRRPHLLRNELNRRLTEWMFPLAFALIATYFSGAARSNRQERLWGLAAAVVVALTFRGFGYFAMNGSGTSPVIKAITFATPASAIVLFSWLIASGRQLRVPQRLVDWVSNIISAVDQRWTALQLWLRGYRKQRSGSDA